MKALVYMGARVGIRFLVKFVAAGLESRGYDVVVTDVRKVSVSDLTSFDLLVVGSSTWDGTPSAPIEGVSYRDMNKEVQGRLQIDMRSFVSSLTDVNLEQRPVAIFGVGHYSYSFPANAGKLLAEAFAESNARVLDDIFLVTDVPDLFSDAIEQWAHDLVV